MADIRLVIKIPQKWFDDMVKEEFTEVDELCAVIQHGTLLSKSNEIYKSFNKGYDRAMQQNLKDKIELLKKIEDLEHQIEKIKILLGDKVLKENEDT